MHSHPSNTPADLFTELSPFVLFKLTLIQNASSSLSKQSPQINAGLGVLISVVILCKYLILDMEFMIKKI